MDDYNSEIHITMLEIEFIEDEKSSSFEKWAHVAYFSDDILVEKNRRKLFPIGDKEFKLFEDEIGEQLTNGEKIIIYYDERDSLNTRIDVYNPYEDHITSKIGDDCLFVFQTKCFNGLNHGR